MVCHSKQVWMITRLTPGSPQKKTLSPHLGPCRPQTHPQQKTPKPLQQTSRILCNFDVSCLTASEKATVLQQLTAGTLDQGYYQYRDAAARPSTLQMRKWLKYEAGWQSYGFFWTPVLISDVELVQCNTTLESRIENKRLQHALKFLYHSKYFCC